MRYLLTILVSSSVLVSGCACQPQNRLEALEQEDRMQEFLQDSSPRSMNGHPKATQEFIKNYKVGTPCDAPCDTPGEVSEVPQE